MYKENEGECGGNNFEQKCSKKCDIKCDGQCSGQCNGKSYARLTLTLVFPNLVQDYLLR